MPNNSTRPTRTQQTRWRIKAAIAFLKRISPKPKRAWAFVNEEDYITVAQHHGF